MFRMGEHPDVRFEVLTVVTVKSTHSVHDIMFYGGRHFERMYHLNPYQELASACFIFLGSFCLGITPSV
jgi:hypothetical protein